MGTDFKVWSFSKPSSDSTIASGRIATFISDTLRLRLVWDEAVLDQPEDGLIIVNGAFAFCGHLPALAAAVRVAKRIIWVQNDYTIAPPKADSKGQSPFRAAFRLRAKDKREPMRFWTTCAMLSSAVKGSKVSLTMPPGHTYINWNSLTYEPLKPGVRQQRRLRADKDLYYYGAFRVGRQDAFERYFRDAEGVNLNVAISSTSAKFEGYQYQVKGSRCLLVNAIPRGSFYEELASHGLGLYIEDKRSHTQFHSPANRFYEMLSAGLPMVFQPEAIDMMDKAGYDIRPYVVKDRAGVVTLMKIREAVGRIQRKKWHRDYRGDLTKRLKQVFKEIS